MQAFLLASTSAAAKRLTGGSLLSSRLSFGAADVSEWAVNLGADGLQPDAHTLQLGEDPGDGDRPRVRMHFAFHPDMPDADRDHFVMALSKVVLRNL